MNVSHKVLVPCARRACSRGLKLFRGFSSAVDNYDATSTVERQNELFDAEKKRQLDFVKRIEKIRVNHVGPNDECSLAMNKYLSTPYHVAMHLNDSYVKRSALAMVNGEPWHMLQPLTEDCDLQFLTMKEEDPDEVNRVFWKASAHMLGALLQDAFKESITVIPVRSPEIPYVMGCFAYDVNLSIQWEPTRQELTSLKRMAYKMCHKKIPFERLEVRREVAEEIFANNVYKLHHLKHVDSERVTLFRLGDFIDVSDGPMVHSIEDYLLPNSKLSRFQGVSLPSDFESHHTAWAVIEDRAKRPVLLDLKPDFDNKYIPEEAESTS
ncbi:putative 39S ribosomal protein L39, mitochondrial isoform X2 [Apostichopus japonicus]|uniref:Putative 39S ribosomal protein L39, mitochondrial isoform X2 n=1 Tax=Stichopus japonicus TaxID=307972 RepID=A0A2G8L332_STIJA|nr:putative 39S ribosomal protein L39, mitochondrial isoform X2 [Apostichopus japonicus]